MAHFDQLAAVADLLADNASRLKKRAAIVDALTTIHAHPESAPEDAGLFALYLAGQPFPEADPRKLNAGGALLSRLVKEVSEATDHELTLAYRRHGDLGAAAFDLLVTRAPATSTLRLTYIAGQFALISVARTTLIRAALVQSLLRQATAREAKYLLKLMLGDMRIGTKQSLIEEAIALAAHADVAAVRNAVMLEADLAGATRRAFAGTLAEARLRLFHPLGFMLASPVETPEEAVERFTAKPAKLIVAKKTKKKKTAADAESIEETADVSSAPEVGEVVAPVADEPRVRAFLEDKYDGMRAQLHLADPSQPRRVAIYSRNREDITESFPELAEAFALVDGETGPLILDGEILAWNFETQQALPFAVLGQRIGRKRVSSEMRAAVPVIFMAFDVFCQRGELTLDLPLTERRNRLEAIAEVISAVAVSPLRVDEHARVAAASPQVSLFGPAEPRDERSSSNEEEATSNDVPRLHLSPARLVQSAAEIDRAYADARARANEGVMLKAADSVYQPGRRGLAWVKLKRELATLDVVITGAEYGSGRRAQSLSDYTFAVRGPVDFEDAEAGPTHLVPGRKGEPPIALYNVGKAYSGVTDLEIASLTEALKASTLEDHGHFRTVEPAIILEVAFNNIMRSTRHASGYALRFPRILRIRTDKPLEEIDTIERVEEVYQSQVDKPEEAE